MNFGEKLKMLRKEKNLSGKQVADGLGIGLRTYRYNYLWRKTHRLACGMNATS